MATRTKPDGWPNIERNIKRRAEYRCECGESYHCDGTHHQRRCNNIEGNRYPHNKRKVALRVVQINRGDDWRGNNLVALCLPCYLEWERSGPVVVAEVEDGLFDYLA